MRLSVIFPVLCVAALGILACDGATLSGPEAQRAYSRVAGDARFVPQDALVLVDDQRVPPGQPLNLDPTRIARIEILKGDAAALVYGNEARRGVVRIYTTGASGSGAPANR